MILLPVSLCRNKYKLIWCNSLRRQTKYLFTTDIKNWGLENKRDLCQLSTLEQAVAWVPGFDPDKCQETVGPQCPWISFGYHNQHFIFAFMEWMRVCLVVSSFMFVLSQRWPRHWADHSSWEALHVLVWSKKYVCDPKFNSLPDRSWLCKARVVWVT